MKEVQGSPLPLGVTYEDGRANFAMEVPEGKSCKLLLYRKGEASLLASYVFCEHVGAVWYLAVEGLEDEAYEYNYEIDAGTVTDPYAKAVSGNGKEMRGIFYQDTYDWENDRHPDIPEDELIAYAMHVRGFTKDSCSKVKHKGTFQGIVEKIPYLKDLGINQIQCMPVYEFEESGTKVNYWGYGDGYYFAPKRTYASDGDGVRGLKDLVKSCHRAGIEVVLEMPFTEETAGTMVVDCLRHYLVEYHVDGFVLNPYHVPMRLISHDPILSGARLLKHDDSFQNVMRRFLKGDEGVVPDVMYQTRRRGDLEGAYNYMTTHTGFTLKDLVSYDGKHNEANGENNQDGPDYNYSWNCGAEGTTRKKAVLKLRNHQMKNAMFLLLLSQGVPCLLAGDEFANSQKGNNNVYCQDNPIGWQNWRNRLKEQELYQFVKHLIGLRKKYKVFHQKEELLSTDRCGCGIPDVSYHGEMAWRAPAEVASRQLGIYYSSQSEEEEECFVAYNMHWMKHEFALPALRKGRKWCRIASTEEGVLKKPERLENQRKMELNEREIVVLTGVREGDTDESTATFKDDQSS